VTTPPKPSPAPKVQVKRAPPPAARKVEPVKKPVVQEKKKN